jgi:hypothetical protein
MTCLPVPAKVEVYSKPHLPVKEKKMMGQHQTMESVAALVRRIILALAIAVLMAMTITATATPAFAKSAANDPSLYKGANFGHYQSEYDLDGQGTAEGNPSYRGGKDKSSNVTYMRTK